MRKRFRLWWKRSTLPQVLGVIGTGVACADPKPLELELDQHFALARSTAEHRGVVGKERLRMAVCRGSFVEHCHDVGGFHRGERDRADQQPAVIVDEIEDLCRRPVLEFPVCGVCLPHLVRQLGLEADEAGAGPLVRLGNDQAVAVEDPARWSIPPGLASTLAPGARRWSPARSRARRLRAGPAAAGTIASTSGPYRCGHRLGRRLRGSSAA